MVANVLGWVTVRRSRKALSFAGADEELLEERDCFGVLGVNSSNLGCAELA